MRHSRWLAAFLLVALAATSVTPASGQIAEPDWLSLPYFQHTYGGWMRVWTNENTFDNGIRVINGDYSAFGNPSPGPTQEESTTEFQALWAEKCQVKKAQTFKTTRQIYMMGMADKLEASLGAYQYSSQGKPGPIDSVKLLINGFPVHEVTGTKSVSIPYSSSDRTVVDISDTPLNYGLNTITVIGHKKKTKKSAGWCTGDNRLGVLAEIYGEFLADVSATDNATGSASDAYAFNVTVTNNGPSDLIPASSYGARFGVSVVSGLSEVSDITIFGLEGCSEPVPISNGSKDGLSSACTIPYMKTGDSFTANVVIHWSNAPVGATSDITYSALGYAELDSELNNNGKTFTVTVVEGG